MTKKQSLINIDTTKHCRNCSVVGQRVFSTCVKTFGARKVHVLKVVVKIALPNVLPSTGTGTHYIPEIKIN